MNATYLAITGETVSTAWVVTLQGMLTIFLVLSALWLVIDIMHRIVHRDEAKAKTEQKTAAPAKAEPVATTAASPAPAATADEGAIIAAITAAIMAARAEQGETGSFRVVSFKRANAHRRFH